MKTNLTIEDKNKVGVYLIHNKETDEKYVGSGILKDRERDHKTKLKNNNHGNYKLQKAFNKNSNFEFIATIIEEPGFTIEENRAKALVIEQEIIDKEKTNPLFLNIALDAVAPMFGRKQSPEHTAKIKEKLIGKKRSEEVKLKQSENFRKQLASGERIPPMLGKTQTPEHIEKRIMARKEADNYKWSEESKELQSKVISEQYVTGERVPVWLGKTLSEEHKQNLSKARIELFESGYINPLIGVPLSEEHKNKLSDIGKKEWESLTEEEKIKRTAPMVAALKGNTHTLGRKQLPEEIAKRIVANTGKKRSKESISNLKEGRRKASTIRFSIYGKEYCCYTDAAIDYDVSVQTVINRVNSNSELFCEWKLILQE